uniref:ATP-dependent DNA helicase PIF1 n=1 Tax=Cajanus cajan TaxID=3821 RepID=A0A151QS72_CAJCA|nr:ATP-dependent DNA helicase PIF1 [Cajanus cajan]
MRLNTTKTNATTFDIKKFANWILQIGDRDMLMDQNGEVEISIPKELLIQPVENPLMSLVQFVYRSILHNLKDVNFFQERAILAPTIESFEQVNDFMLSVIPGEEKNYLSSDTPCPSDEETKIQGEWFTSKFLNDVKCYGVPNHKLTLKVGVPIMLLRNLDQSNGLCNGTRFQVTDLGTNVISATVITDTNIGANILIPRMNLVPSDPGFPFKFQRRQFPLCLYFEMNINKSQGQSLSMVELFLPKPIFIHGHLYVAASRVKSMQGLKILILDEDSQVCNSTKNVVYKEVFENL